MRELDCKFGGEMSGHIFFADDYYGYDDALYVAARLVQLLSRSAKTLSELTNNTKIFFNSVEIRMEAKMMKKNFKLLKSCTIFHRKL